MDAQLPWCMAATACFSAAALTACCQGMPGRSTVVTVCCHLRRQHASCPTLCLSALQFKGLPASTQVLSLSSARFSARPFPSYMPSAKAELVSPGKGLVFVIVLGGTGS